MAVQMAHHFRSAMRELRYEPVSRRIRCSLEGEPVVDTTDAALVWEPRRVVPMYAVPPSDIAAEIIDEGAAEVPVGVPPVMGPANFSLHTCPGRVIGLTLGERVLHGVGFRPDAPELAGRIELSWGEFDWREEEQDVLGHPHDPFSRIDILAAGRHVVVSLGDQVIADSRRPKVLYETGLPPRWYLPAEDVRTDLLEPSDTLTTCAYKGHAEHFSLTAAGPDGKDVAWVYRQPLHEVAPISGLVCFYNERTDVSVDGVTMPRPRTEWSKKSDTSDESTSAVSTSDGDEN
jgi:uncharacterized protein (DUF427 family)